MRRIAVASIVVFFFVCGSALAAGRSPRATFTVSPANPTAGQDVTLDATASSCFGTGWSNSCASYAWDDDGDASDPLDAPQWHLGDGSVLHFAFGGAGTKYVWLTVTDASGRATQTMTPITVTASSTPTPTPSPTPTPTPSPSSTPTPTPPPSTDTFATPTCAAGATNATSASAVRSNAQAGRDVCVTAGVGDVDLSSINPASDVHVGTNGGSIGHITLQNSSHVAISARFRSVELRGTSHITIDNSVIGGTPSARVYDQLIFAPDSNPDLTVTNSDIGWTLADTTGNTGYGCRCYGDLTNLRFVGNKVHDIAADGFQGVGGTNVLIDRNEIGPVGANPGSDEHSDLIQITGNDAGLRITNNWLHHQGYFRDASGNLTVVGNAGATYIHGGSTGALTYENNLVQTAQGRVEVCGLGTGGTSRSNITIRQNTFTDLGIRYTGFPGFEWDCDSGSGNLIERNIAVDPDGGLAQDGSQAAATWVDNLWGQPSLVTLDSDGNCVSANCTTAFGQPIGYRKPMGVHW